jgi:hypothetical protein
MREQLADFQRKVKDDLCRYFQERDGVVPRSIDGIFGDGGSLTRTFQNFFDPSDGRLCRLMQSQIGPESAFGRALDPQNKQGIVALVEARVQELVEAKLDEVLEQFSLDEGGSAMFRLKEMLSEFFDRLNQSLGIKAGAAEEASKGHVKGIEFEADLYSAFAEIGRRLGDETENVRATPGLLRRKTGDYVATLGETTGAPGTRIAVEVKNQRVRLKDAIDEMQEAKQNRSATIGIYVFAKGCEPPEVGDFRRVGEDFYCTVDWDHIAVEKPLVFIEAAYQVARALAVATARSASDEALDVQKLMDHVDALISYTERLSDVTTKARTVKNSGEAIEKAAEALKKELETRLTEMQLLLRSNLAA